MTGEQMVQVLRARYDEVKSVDPTGAAYANLAAFLDAQPQDVLVVLSKAKIKWVSSLALNRVKKV
jgi:hypothetical protein